MKIRRYLPMDYEELKALYLDSATFGGQFDTARDSKDRLQKKIEADPDAILVVEENEKILGTISIIDDGRVAWLFRFAAPSHRLDIMKALHDEAVQILSNRGHQEVLVYSPVGNEVLDRRYLSLGFTKGNNYTCYWKEL